MIYPAILYKERLEKIFVLTRIPRYKFFYADGFFSTPEIADDEWSIVQRVSIDQDDNILGFLSCRIRRPINNGYNVQMINFGEQDITFSRDIIRFFTSMFQDYGLRKINFSVVIGNPAEEMYDKVIIMFNGRIIGVTYAEVMLPNGEIRNEKFYEIMRSSIEHRL